MSLTSSHPVFDAECTLQRALLFLELHLGLCASCTWNSRASVICLHGTNLTKMFAFELMLPHKLPSKTVAACVLVVTSNSCSLCSGCHLKQLQCEIYRHMLINLQTLQTTSRCCSTEKSKITVPYGLLVTANSCNVRYISASLLQTTQTNMMTMNKTRSWTACSSSISSWIPWPSTLASAPRALRMFQASSQPTGIAIMGPCQMQSTISKWIASFLR